MLAKVSRSQYNQAKPELIQLISPVWETNYGIKVWDYKKTL